MEVRIYKERKNPLEILSSGDLIIRQNEMVVKGYESTPTGEEGKSDTVEIEEYQYFETVVPSSDTKKEECISLVKDVVLKLITDHDGSVNVNSFTINGMKYWLDKETRAGLILRFNAEKSAGKTETTLWVGNNSITLAIDDAIKMLYALEVYASACYDNTASHKANVSALTTVEEVMNYDYKTGYPAMLRFNL